MRKIAFFVAAFLLVACDATHTADTRATEDAHQRCLELATDIDQVETCWSTYYPEEDHDG